MSSTRSQQVRQKAVADALAGVVGSLVSLWVAYPIDVLKTNIQAGRESSWNPDQLFAGWKSKTLHTASSSFCYFYLYSWIFSSWTASRKKKQISAPTRLVLSAIAAMLNTCATLPFDVISTRHQTADAGNKIIEREGSEDSDGVYDDCSDDEEKKDDSEWLQHPFPESLQRRLSTRIKNFLSLWKGLVPSLLLCSNPAIHFTVFDMTKAQLLRRRGKSNLSMMDAFLLGMLAKFVATVTTYPLIRAKVILMVTSETNIVQCLRTEYRKHGLPGLYRGCNIQLLHTLLKSALLMTIRERISRTTQRILVTETPPLTNR
jgi:adenine nucleotide transporter 17